MEPRINIKTIDPEVYKTLLGLGKLLAHSGLDRRLLNFVYLRASQINGCAYCIDMHRKDLRAEGETEQRVYLLDGWREAPIYTDRERAALAWTEAVTKVTEGHVPDEVYEQARAQFSERELVYLTVAVGAINVWNRLNVAFRTVAGDYQPGMLQRAGSPAV